MPGLDTALDTLKGFSQAFFRSYFFPVVVFITANSALYIAVFGRAEADRLIKDFGLDTTVGLALVPFLALGLAWVISGMTVPARQLLEGQGLPRWLTEELVQEERQAFEQLKKEDARAKAALAAIAVAAPQWRQRLIEARKEGVSGGSDLQDPASCSQAVTALSEVDYSPATGTDFFPLLEAAGAALEQALKKNNVESSVHAEAMAALKRAHVAFLETMDAAEREAWTRAATASFPLTSRFAQSDLRPTRLGNLRAVMEHHTLQAYGVEFAFLWPRIQVLLKEDDPVAATLEQAKSQLEFAVVMTVITAFIAVIWLVAIPLAGGSTILFLTIAGLSPILLGFFYKLAIEGQKALTEAVRSVVDVSRLNLLDHLGVERPADSAAERVLWRELQDLSLGVPAVVKLKGEGA